MPGKSANRVAPMVRRVERAPGLSSSAARGQGGGMHTYKRPILELPVDVICGVCEPSGGITEIAAAVRLCLVNAGGPADAAFANIAQARGTAAAIRLARAYVDVRAAETAA
jgi:hypothetical protein